MVKAGKIYVEGTKDVLNDPQIQQRLFRKEDVEAVDLIIKRARGRQVVKTDDDWSVVEMIVSFYFARWPKEAEEIKESVKQIRETRKNDGDSKTKELRYVAALPPKLERMIKICFPFQQYDKAFMNKFVKKVPLFRVSGF
jgi:hypothetical protein